MFFFFGSNNADNYNVGEKVVFYYFSVCVDFKSIFMEYMICLPNGHYFAYAPKYDIDTHFLMCICDKGKALPGGGSGGGGGGRRGHHTAGQ